MTELDKIVRSLETCSDNYYRPEDSCSSCHCSQNENCFAELIYQTIKLLKRQQDNFQTAKNVAERYAQLLGESGTEYVRTWFGVIKGGKLMYSYRDKHAKWTYSSDEAWLTCDKEMAEGFAKLTKAKVAEITIAVRPLK